MALTKVTGHVVLPTTNIEFHNTKSTGIVTFTHTSNATSSTTGALQVTGGVGIVKDLHVGGNITVGGTLTYDDVTNIDSLGIITARNGIYLDKFIYHLGDLNTSFGFPNDATDTFVVNTNSSEKFRITSGGSVNLGTGELTQTARKFNVYGGATRVTQTSGGNTVEVFGHTTSGQSYGLLVNAGSTSGDYCANFRNSSGTALFRIRGDGNIGVGTASPATKLHVDGGNITIRNGTAAGVILSEESGVGGSLKVTTATGNASFGPGNSTFCHVQTDRGGGFYLNKRITVDEGIIGSYDEDLQLHSPLNTRRVTIDKDTGKVGINTSSPLQMLHVYSGGYGHPLLLERGDNSNTQIEIRQNGTTRGYWGSSSTANFMVYDDDTSNINFVVKQNGKVGIGDDDPDYMLQIKGAVPAIAFEDTSGTHGFSVIEQNNDNLKIRCDAGNQSSGYNSNIRFEIDGTEKVRIKHNGYVGIGTDNPSALLHVAKYTYDDPDNENFFRIKLQDQGGVMNDVGIGQIASGSLSFNNTASGRFSFHNGTNGEIFRIASSNSNGGGVGISTAGGNISPDGNALLIRAKSTVGTTKGHIMLTGDGATNGEGPQIVFSESGSGSNFAGAYIGHIRATTNSVGHLVFGTRETGGDANTVPTERLRIGSNGSMYLGYNASDGLPVQDGSIPGNLRLFSIHGTGTSLGIKLTNSSTGTTTGDGLDIRLHGYTAMIHQNEAYDLQLQSKGALAFRTGSTPAERLRIKSDGNITISNTTTSPSGDFRMLTLIARSDKQASIGFAQASGVYSGATTTGGYTVRLAADAALELATHNSNLVALKATQTGNVEMVGDLSTNNLSGRNVIINGEMRVAQRATSASVSDHGATYDVCDRWNFNRHGVTSTIAQVAETPDAKGFYYSLKWTSTSAVSGSLHAGNNLKWVYKVERQDIQRLGYGASGAKKATLSFWAKGSLSGKIGISCIRDSRIFSANEDIVANTWKFVEITIPADTSTGFSANDNATGFQLGICWGAGSNSTSGTTGGSWINFHTAYSAGFTAGQQGAYLTTNGSTFQITGVQLEIGSQSTPFEFLGYGDQLKMCQRYYAIFHPTTQEQVYIESGATNTHSFWAAPVPAGMRAEPTVNLLGTWTGHGMVSGRSVYAIALQGIDNGGNSGTTHPGSVGRTSFRVTRDSGGTYTTGQIAHVDGWGNGNAWIGYDAEL